MTGVKHAEGLLAAVRMVPLAGISVCLVLAICGVQRAYAEDIEEVRAQLSAQVEELGQLQADIESTRAHVEALEDQMKAALGEIDEVQARYAKLQDGMSLLAVGLYKDREDFSILNIVEKSTTLDELLYRLDVGERVLGRYHEMAREARETRESLSEKYAGVSSQKDEQLRLVKEMKQKSEQLDESIEYLKAREKELSVDEQAALAQAAASARQIAQTFATGTVGNDDIGWRTGPASAYGGSTDASTPNPGRTATGTICDDWSVGVAVPMVWGAEQYYGLRVEISYGGQSIIAPVVDCGNMGSGARDLDLQPGVFKAFGFWSCADWGVRQVSYRFL